MVGKCNHCGFAHTLKVVYQYQPSGMIREFCFNCGEEINGKGKIIRNQTVVLDESS